MQEKHFLIQFIALWLKQIYKLDWAWLWPSPRTDHLLNLFHTIAEQSATDDDEKKNEACFGQPKRCAQDYASYYAHQWILWTVYVFVCCDRINEHLLKCIKPDAWRETLRQNKKRWKTPPHWSEIDHALRRLLNLMWSSQQTELN